MHAQAHSDVTAKKPATYADIEALPPHLTGQIIDGELFVSPRPAPAHARTVSTLGGLINVQFDVGLMGPGGWRILDEPEIHLDTAVLVPDIAGWRLENWTDQIQTAAIKTAPDWICEVLSPSTERFDRSRKLMTYGRLGIRHAWLVHPTRHFVEVYENRAGAWVLLTVEAGNSELRAAPFDAVGISLKAIWLNPPDEPGEAGAGDQ